MIFSKDDYYGQLPNTHKDKLMFFKIMLASVAMFIVLFLTLAKFESYIGIVVLILGIVWNLFLPLNSIYSVLFSVLMGSVYAYICANSGLFANAFLYLAYYVPMQFMAYNSLNQDFILQKKKLSEKESIFIFGFYIVFCIFLFLFSYSISGIYLSLIDAGTATLLAISALLRNLRTHEFYLFRFISLIASILMWAIVASASNVFGGVYSIVVMYSLYLIYDFISMIYDKKYYVDFETIANNQLKEFQKKRKAELKKQEYIKNSSD